MYFCGVNYREENYRISDSQEDTELDSPTASKRIEERVRVYEDEGVELINIPVPKFSDSDPADIVHDFNRVRASVYLPLSFTKPYMHNNSRRDTLGIYPIRFPKPKNKLPK